MEFDAVSTDQLKELALFEKSLGHGKFAGVFASDTLPKSPSGNGSRGYIVNTDPHHRPGRHWIALWTEDETCQVMDSYGLPLASHRTPHLQVWLRKHYKITEANTQSLQAYNSSTCGHYALKFLIDRSQGKTFSDFLDQFSPFDYVYNDAMIARWMTHKMLKYRPPIHYKEEFIYPHSSDEE